MLSGSSPLWHDTSIEVALNATFFAIAAIASLILYIWARRYVRARYFMRRDSRAFEIRKRWQDYVSLQIPPESWRTVPLDRELVETMLLDQIDIAQGEELANLLYCFRISGLLDLRVYEARTSHGWRRQAALASLGRTRQPEAIAALSEALDSTDPQEVTSAVRALGRIKLSAAAVPILDRLAEGKLNAAPVPLKTALVSCCRSNAALLMKYITGAPDDVRATLARALAEVISPELGDELSVLCQDPSAEVRASVARALGRVRAEYSAALLSTMTMDETWFVRVRAVVALGALRDPTSIDALVRCLCDTNRVVRQRSAMALVQFRWEAPSILKSIIATGDRYGLHSFVSELQRSGRYGDLLQLLQRGRSNNEYRDLMETVEGVSDELNANTALAQPLAGVS